MVQFRLLLALFIKSVLVDAFHLNVPYTILYGNHDFKLDNLDMLLNHHHHHHRHHHHHHRLLGNDVNMEHIEHFMGHAMNNLKIFQPYYEPYNFVVHPINNNNDDDEPEKKLAEYMEDVSNFAFVIVNVHNDSSSTTIKTRRHKHKQLDDGGKKQRHFLHQQHYKHVILHTINYNTLMDTNKHLHQEAVTIHAIVKALSNCLQRHHQEPLKINTMNFNVDYVMHELQRHYNEKEHYDQKERLHMELRRLIMETIDLYKIELGSLCQLIHDYIEIFCRLNNLIFVTMGIIIIGIVYGCLVSAIGCRERP